MNSLKKEHNLSNTIKGVEITINTQKKLTNGNKKHYFFLSISYLTPWLDFDVWQRRILNSFKCVPNFTAAILLILTSATKTLRTSIDLLYLSHVLLVKISKIFYNFYQKSTHIYI